MVNSTSGGSRGQGGIARGPQPRTSTPPQQAPLAQAADHTVFARVVDQATQQPISGARYEVVNAQGTAVASGTTDWQGTVRHNVPQAGTYTVRVTELPASGGAAGGT